jgi:hypothetical protein
MTVAPRLAFTRRLAPALRLILALALAIFAFPVEVGAALSAPQRGLLHQYLDAIGARHYDVAFGLLSDDERRYFGSAKNLASVYTADRFKLDSYRIIESKNAPPLGTVAVVSERIEFFDSVRQSPASATVKVAYGIIARKGHLGIKDPYHPWRAFAPEALAADSNKVKVTVRKISFFTGRVEIVLAFQNLADQAVTFLPYGRTVLRDEAGKAYTPIESRISALTDKTLYTGLRLPSSGQYTGSMAFFTPDRFDPSSLTLTVAPALFDGGDAPFELDLPVFPIPK